MIPSRISRCIGHQSSMSCVTIYRSNRVALFTRRGDPKAWGKAPAYVNGVSEGVSFPYRQKYQVALRGVSEDRGTSKVLTTRDSRSELHSPLTVRSFLARSEKTNQKRGATPKDSSQRLLNAMQPRTAVPIDNCRPLSRLGSI